MKPLQEENSIPEKPRVSFMLLLAAGTVKGGLSGLSLWVAGIEGAGFWGAMMIVLSMVPYLSPALVWVPAVVFLMLDGKIAAAAGVGLWCAIIDITFNKYLRPLLNERCSASAYDQASQ